MFLWRRLHKHGAPPKLFSHLYLPSFSSFFLSRRNWHESNRCLLFFLLFLTFFFFSLFFFLIRFPEERFTCSQFCAYFAFSFSLCVFVFFLVVAMHAQFMHARWFTAAFRLSFRDCHEKIIASLLLLLHSFSAGTLPPSTGPPPPPHRGCGRLWPVQFGQSIFGPDWGYWLVVWPILSNLIKFNPASKEMISDSVELCETEVCFLHIQLIGTNVSLPKCTVFHPK